MNWKNFNDIIGKEIKLFELKGNEKVSLWDNTDKCYVQENSTIKLADGTDLVWDRYKKLDKCEPKRYGRSVQHTREVYVDDDNYMVGFKHSVEMKLQEINKLLESVGQGDIVGKYFTISKEGEGLKTKYDIGIVNKDAVATEEKPTTTPEHVEEVKVEAPKEPSSDTIHVTHVDPHLTDLDETEKKLFETYKEFIRKNNHKPGDESVKKGIVDGLIRNGVEEKRANWMYAEYFIKLC